jgi:hypothetical protein
MNQALYAHMNNKRKMKKKIKGLKDFIKNHLDQQCNRIENQHKNQ